MISASLSKVGTPVSSVSCRGQPFMQMLPLKISLHLRPIASSGAIPVISLALLLKEVIIRLWSTVKIPSLMESKMVAR